MKSFRPRLGYFQAEIEIDDYKFEIPISDINANLIGFT